MTESICFHENMVIWTKNNIWNGFGFFGQSVHGKTPLSCALARDRFVRGYRVKIFDDKFTLENDIISKCQNGGWGGEDLLGCREDLIRTVEGSGKSIEDLYPETGVEYSLNKVTFCLLLFLGEEGSSNLEESDKPKIKKCSRAEFVQILVTTNPLWIDPQPDHSALLEIIPPRLNLSWNYLAITRRRLIEYSLQKKIINNLEKSNEEKAMRKRESERLISLSHLLLKRYIDS